jgi:hypothetical protein
MVTSVRLGRCEAGVIAGVVEWCGPEPAESKQAG